MKSSAVSQIIKKVDRNDHLIEKSKKIELQHDKITFGSEGEFELRVADTIELRKKAYQLIYNIYLEKNYIQPHSSEMWFSKFDASASTVTLVVLKGDRVVGTLSLVFDSDDGMPADDLYSDELNQQRKYGKQMVELVSLGIDSELRGTEVLIKLFNASSIISREIYGRDHFIITVNPRHVNFYQKKLAFSEIGGLKECPKVSGAPSKLLSMDLDEYRRLVDLSTIENIKTKTFFDHFISSRDALKLNPVFISQMYSSQNSLGEINEIMKTRDDIEVEFCF